MFLLVLRPRLCFSIAKKEIYSIWTLQSIHGVMKIGHNGSSHKLAITIFENSCWKESINSTIKARQL